MSPLLIAAAAVAVELVPAFVVVALLVRGPLPSLPAVPVAPAPGCRAALASVPGFHAVASPQIRPRESGHSFGLFLMVSCSEVKPKYWKGFFVQGESSAHALVAAVAALAFVAEFADVRTLGAAVQTTVLLRFVVEFQLPLLAAVVVVATNLLRLVGVFPQFAFLQIAFAQHLLLLLTAGGVATEQGFVLSSLVR